MHLSSKENSDTGWAFAAAARVSHVFNYIKLPRHHFETHIHRFPPSIPPALFADMQICSLPRLFPAGSSLAGLVLSLLINCPRLHIDGDSSFTTLTNSILAPIACALFHTEFSGLSNLATIATIETLINTHFVSALSPRTHCLILDLAAQDKSSLFTFNIPSTSDVFFIVCNGPQVSAYAPVPILARSTQGKKRILDALGGRIGNCKALTPVVAGTIPSITFKPARPKPHFHYSPYESL